MLQVKFDFWLNYFNLGWFSNFLCLLGLGDKGIENQPGLKQIYPEIKFDL